MEEPVETYFLKYAFPCTFVIRLRKQVDEPTFRMLEAAAMNGTPVDRTTLEGTYKKAFMRMKKVALELGKDYWSPEVIREYFVNRHNAVIAEDEGYKEAPATLRELCRTEHATVVDQRDGILVVQFGEGKTRTVSSVFVPDAKVGDRVVIHYGYAIEVE